MTEYVIHYPSAAAPGYSGLYIGHYQRETRGREDPPPMPICAVCRRPVDHVEWEKNIERNAVQVTVQCHGTSERFFLTDDFIFAMRGAPQIDILPAFAPKGASA